MDNSAPRAIIVRVRARVRVRVRVDVGTDLVHGQLGDQGHHLAGGVADLGLEVRGALGQRQGLVTPR